MKIPIPEYRQRIAPQGVGVTPHATGVAVSGAEGMALAEVGNAGTRFLAVQAANEDDKRRELERQRDEDGKVWVATQLASTQEKWLTELQARKESAAPGAPEFTPSLLKDYDAYKSELVDKAYHLSPHAKAFATERLASFRSELAHHAIGFEAVARIDNKVDQSSQATQSAASAVMIDPESFEKRLQERVALIRLTDLPQVEKSKQLDLARSTLARSAATAMVRRDPRGMYELLTGIPQRDSAPIIDDAATDPAAPPSTAPRGIRNNNPGNITRSSSKWDGEIESTDPRYTAFATPEHGIRAMAVNLLRYQDRYGLATPQALISRWAPASENNTGAYVANVAAKAGVQPNEAIDLHDRAALTGFVRAMIEHENGQDPYSDAQVAAGVKAALDGQPITKANAKFDAWYASRAQRFGLNPNPDDSRHFYDYRAAFAAGAEPDAEGHWPSKYKRDGHPRMVVDGVNTKTGEIAWDKLPPTGLSAVDLLDWREREHLATQAQTEIHRQQADFRAQLHGRIVDAEAKAKDGIRDPAPMSMGAFISGFGQRDGVERFAQYQRGQVFAGDVAAMRGMTPDERTALLERTKPAADTPGYAAEDSRWNVRLQVATQLRKEELDDPMGTAIRRGISGAQPLKVTDPAELAKGLAPRVGVATSVASTYLTEPRVFTKAESAAMASLLKAAPVNTTKQYLGALYKGLDGDIALYKLTMQQIAPDAPVVALAGMYQARGLKTPELATTGLFGGTPGRPASDVADLILRGNAILNPMRKADGSDHMGGKSLLKMPPSAEMLALWTAETGAAFRGKENAADLYYQASLSTYAALSAEQGAYEGALDSARWKNAIHLATGGIQRHNGAEIVLPYAMPLDNFRDGLKVRAESLVANKVPLGIDGADELVRLPLENVGDGRYMFRRGSGYIVDHDGRPVVIDFNIAEQRPVGGAQPAPFLVRDIPNPGNFAITKGGAATGSPRRR